MWRYVRWKFPVLTSTQGPKSASSHPLVTDCCELTHLNCTHRPHVRYKQMIQRGGKPNS